jgi:Holliday junction resolvasome RuvABC DNA-binding subunit
MSTPEISDEKLDIIRMENERYLRRHPELNKMISEFMIALLKDKPNEVLPYAVVFFTSSQVEPD